MSINAGIFERTHVLLGNAGIETLQSLNVLVVGVGGVGGNACEALVRAGVGSLTIVDNDVVSVSNLNRQVVALGSQVGKSKVEVMFKRLQDINPLCRLAMCDMFVLPEDVEFLLDRRDAVTNKGFDYVVDCIDSVSCKVALLVAAVKGGMQVLTSCGAGGRLDPTAIVVGDLFDSENDALAAHCRKALRSQGIGRGSVRAVFSTEKGRPPLAPQRQESGGRDRAMNGTISHMPPMFGMFLSSMVIHHATTGGHLTSACFKRSKKQQRALEEAERRHIESTRSSSKQPAGGDARPKGKRGRDSC